MSGQTNAPVIIKRKKVVGGDGHHGGAWKVAYADFVTAMMAFFMLMWLLNATTEQQRKGIADYFTPTIAINRISGGGEGLFGGEDILSNATELRSGPGGMDVPEQSDGASEEAAASIAETDALIEMQEMLLGTGGEALISEQALRHVVTRLTDEGLVIELFALPDAPLFEGLTDRPRPLTVELLEMVARVSALLPNPVAVEAHVPAQPIVLAENPVWDVTTDRAMEVRRVLEAAGLDPARTRRLTGHGDREPFTEQPLEVRNDRVEITILRNTE